MVAAAKEFLARLSPSESRICHLEMNSERWRTWQNTEMVLEDYGLRLDRSDRRSRDGAIAVLRAFLSPRGVAKARGVMRLNGFFGDLLGTTCILGEWSYTFCLLGTPSTTEPWGWQLFEHHMCLNGVVLGRQMVLTPSFLGAEIVEADRGPHSGTSLFEDEERLGLALMQSLPSELCAQAQMVNSMANDDLPEGRWHFFDQLHLGGAYRDNRIVPYEELSASSMPTHLKRDLIELAAAYFDMLTSGPFNCKMPEIERHLDNTHFCWIGGSEANSTFYYHIQNPVVFIEFDHHSGVF